MAGKSGLNVTKDEALPAFQARFDSEFLAPMLAEFGPDQVHDWCRAFGSRGVYRIIGPGVPENDESLAPAAGLAAAAGRRRVSNCAPVGAGPGLTAMALHLIRRRVGRS